MAGLSLHKKYVWGHNTQAHTGLTMLENEWAWIALDVRHLGVTPYFAMNVATRDNGSEVQRWALHHWTQQKTLLPYVRYTPNVDSPLSLLDEYPVSGALEVDGVLWASYQWHGSETMQRKLTETGWLLSWEGADASVGQAYAYVDRVMGYLTPYEMRLFKLGHMDKALNRVPHEAPYIEFEINETA